MLEPVWMVVGRKRQLTWEIEHEASACQYLAERSKSLQSGGGTSPNLYRGVSTALMYSTIWAVTNRQARASAAL